MKKTQLMKEREAAMSRGDEDVARELAQKLSALEERASELDKMRTSTISSISYINDRNRKKNVEEAEKAIMAEYRATKGIKVCISVTPSQGFSSCVLFEVGVPHKNLKNL